MLKCQVQCDNEYKKDILVFFFFNSPLGLLTAIHVKPKRASHLSVCCVGGFLHQEDMKFSFVKIENYNTFDMSAFAFSAFRTIDVKHSKVCGLHMSSSTVTIICYENVETPFTWLLCLVFTSVNKGKVLCFN